MRAAAELQEARLLLAEDAERYAATATANANAVQIPG